MLSLINTVLIPVKAEKEDGNLKSKIKNPSLHFSQSGYCDRPSARATGAFIRTTHSEVVV
jgi:hypothetical protein